MTMIIVDKHGNNITQQDPVIVPRIGEKVKWAYEPHPTVKMVLYDYKEKTITVVVE